MARTKTKADEEPFKSAFFTDEEIENAKLTLQHGLPASLVKELQSQGKVKYGDARVILSTTVAPATAAMLNELCESSGLTRGRLIDKIVQTIRQAREDEDKPNKLDRLARRKKP